MLMTSSRRAGACSRRHSIRIVGDARLYNLKKVGFPAIISRKTNLVLLYFLTQKFFAYFFTKK